MPLMALSSKYFQVALCLGLTSSAGAAPDATKAPSFDSDIQPLFAAKCISCHGSAPQAKLDLRTAEASLKGGASGASIVPGDAAKSLLVDKIVTGQMPPGKTKLTNAEMDLIRGWIDQGLKGPVGETVAKAGPPVSETEVRAILQVRCVTCHGGTRREGDLDLRTVASRLKGGKSGPALVPGKPDESLMLKRIVNGSMPPERAAKLAAVELATPTEIDKLRSWIAAGAPEAPKFAAPPSSVKEKDRQFWAFQPPTRPDVPKVKNEALVRNPIDAFLLAKLEAKGLSYSTEAGKLTLMRRAYLDLTGLPPTSKEIAEYESDKTAGAYEKMIDRLLASPRYGERWGQHWLDLAGYSDSEGFGQDDGVRPFAWRYRDYVIRSLNADKPYTQFLTEQIAGDEMSNDWKSAKGVASQELIDRLAATGFLRETPDQTDSFERALIAERMNVVADEVEVLASSVMGITVGCARCHDHKYDPIPQRDYYRLSAILQAAYDPYEWQMPSKRIADLALESERKETETWNAPLEVELKQIEGEIKSASNPLRTQLLEERLATLPADVRDDLRKAAALEPEKRNELQKYLADKFSASIKVSDRELVRKFPDLQETLQPLQKKLQAVKSKLKPKPHVRILADNAEPSVNYLLRRGDPVGFGDPVDAGVPAVLKNAALKDYSPVSPFPGATGRRLALAKWLTQPNHPLTARVAVNQLWMRHFDRGIVPSVSNFGHSGAPPSHPELLDWLATEFVNKGWSMKSMHRLIMTSQAYRQTSKVESSKILDLDPDNALLSRMPLRRMDSDTLWDSLITAAGRLDSKAFGPPADIEVTKSKEVIVKPSENGFRRSIYVLHRRQTPVSLMDSFDQPVMTPNCTERRRSNVATQALHMMNGSMSWELARYMAGRVIDTADDPAKQVEAIYLRAYTRKPSEAEIKTGVAAIEEFRKQWPERLNTDHSTAPRAATANWLAVANFCHAILNSAEFSFID